MHEKSSNISPFTISAVIGAISAVIILYLTKGMDYFTVKIATTSLTGYETSPISIAKWELGVLIFIVGVSIYNYKQNSLEKKSNTEWSYILIGLMTQGVILAIGAY